MEQDAANAEWHVARQNAYDLRNPPSNSYEENDMSATRFRLGGGVRTGALASVAASFFAMAPLGVAHAQEACVAYRNIQHIHMVDDMTAVIATQRETVRVTFRGTCQVTASGEFFVLDRFQLGQCVSPGDVFNSSGVSAPCTIVDVTPLPDALQNEQE
jgi:hypothetical protein